MKTLLYIGNKLESKGRSASTIDTLGPLFESEGYKVRYASSRLNIAERFISMMWTTLRYGTKSDFVLIDTYSTLNFVPSCNVLPGLIPLIEQSCFTVVPYFLDKELSVSPLLIVWNFLDFVDFVDFVGIDDFVVMLLLSATISVSEFPGI